MKVAHTSTTSTDSAHASGDDEPWLPKIPGPRKPSSLGPRPPFPAQAPVVRHLSHDLPTAPYRPAALTREQLDREIAAAKQHEPYLVGYGGIQAHAF
jgi:hypothetical protein